VASLFTRVSREWTAEQRVRALLGLCYGDPGQVTPEEFRYAVEELERRLRLPYFWDVMARSSRGVVNAYTLGGQHGLWRQAERVLAPTLLVYGRRDQLVGYRMAQRAARAFRDSRLLSLPDAGHVAMMEYPEIVAKAFRELLADAGKLGTSRETAADTGIPAEGDRGVVTGRRTADAEALGHGGRGGQGGRGGRGGARGVREGGSVSTVSESGGAGDGAADDTNAGS
jgi:hypothetical protein